MADIPQNQKALDILQSLFGGYQYTQLKSNVKWKDKIAWTVVSQKALACLKAVRPYLVIKQDQADLLIEFQEKLISRKGRKMDEEKRKKQEAFFYEVRKLHIRGNLRLQRLSEKTGKPEATV